MLIILMDQIDDTFTFVGEAEETLFSLVDYIDLVLEPWYLKLFIDCSN